MNKPLFRLFLLLLMFSALGLTSCLPGKSTSPPPAAAQSGQTYPVVAASGTVRAVHSATLTWQTGGRVETVNVQVGQAVSARQELAALSPDSVSSGILQAEAERIAAQQTLEDLENSNLTLALALKKLSTAMQITADAQERLDSYERGRGSQALLDDLADQIKTAQEQVKFMEWVGDQFYKHSSDSQPKKAEYNLQLLALQQRLNSLTARYNWFSSQPSETLLETLRADLNLAIARQEDAQCAIDRLDNGKNLDDIQSAQARLAAAQSKLNQAAIRAPFAGTITRVLTQPGDRVTPGAAAFQLDDLSRLLLDLEISEMDINSIAVGQPVEVNFDAIPGKTYQGAVNTVDLVGQNRQGVVGFSVTVALLNADEQIKPGMTASAIITIR